MTKNEIIAKSTKLGQITRNFKQSMDAFTTGLNNEIRTIEYSVNSVNGWEGELYDGFREKMTTELSELKKLASKSIAISDSLDRLAVQYDILIEKLTNASKK